MLVVGFGHFEVNMNIEQDEHGERLNKVNYILNPQKNVRYTDQEGVLVAYSISKSFIFSIAIVNKKKKRCLNTDLYLSLHGEISLI